MNLASNHGAIYKDLYGVKVLSLLNERGDPPFLFPNLSSYNTNRNQWAKFDKNFSLFQWNDLKQRRNGELTIARFEVTDKFSHVSRRYPW